MTALAAWRPPHGRDSQQTRAGVAWDAVAAPSCMGDAALAALGDASGAVIRDAYGHRLYWLLPLGSVRTWQPLSGVEEFGPACWVTVPPTGRTTGLGPLWERTPTENRLLTNPGSLHVALAGVCGAGRCTNPRCP